jgi:hypothetical protein
MEIGPKPGARQRFSLLGFATVRRLIGVQQNQEAVSLWDAATGEMIREYSK